MGDPLLKTRIETGNLLERAKIHRRQRDHSLRQMERLVSDFPGKWDTLAQRRSRLEDDLTHFGQYRETLSKPERLAFGEDLLEALAENVRLPGERVFDHLHGFIVILPADMEEDKPRVILSGTSTNRYEVDMLDAKASGCVQRIEYLLQHLQDRIRSVEAEMDRAESDVCQAKAELKKGNPYAEEVAALQAQLLDIDNELNRRAELCVA